MAALKGKRTKKHEAGELGKGHSRASEKVAQHSQPVSREAHNLSRLAPRQSWKPRRTAAEGRLRTAEFTS